MPIASERVAVVATHVAYTDRRALSEAWFSALHVARGPLAPRGGVAHRTAASTLHAASAKPAASARPGDPLAARPLRENGRRSGAVRGVAEERRRPACDTSRRVERAVATLAQCGGRHGAQTIDVAGGRVRLLVRTDRGTTRIIAVCSAPLRGAVERALANARFALAASGAPLGWA